MFARVYTVCMYVCIHIIAKSTSYKQDEDQKYMATRYTPQRAYRYTYMFICRHVCTYIHTVMWLHQLVNDTNGWEAFDQCIWIVMYLHQLVNDTNACTHCVAVPCNSVQRDETCIYMYIFKYIIHTNQAKPTHTCILTTQKVHVHIQTERSPPRSTHHSSSGLLCNLRVTYTG
jgi:hypothetical protein